MDDFMSHTIITFHKIQGLTTLVAQQVELDAFVESFIDDIGVTGPFIVESIQDLDPTTHVFNGCHVVSLSNVQEFFIGLVSGWKESSTKPMRSNKTNYNAMMDSSSSWLMSALT
jgi:hypothetical protein